MSDLPRWYKGLTSELKKYAEDTIGETDEVREQALREFRQLIKKQNDIDSRDEDIFLLRFLRAKKFDVKKSLQVFRNYYKFLDKQKGTFTRKKPSDLRRFMEMNFTLVTPYHLPNGSPLSITLLGNLDASQATQQDVVAVLLSVGELFLEMESTQVCGCTRVLDLKGLSLRHYTQFITFPFISLLINTFQDCWPERVKAIHIVHEPTIVHVIGNLIKPLMKKKMKERIHFHGDSFESLHEHIPKDYLPEELGGTTGPFDNTEYASYYYSHESFFEKVNTFGVIAT